MSSWKKNIPNDWTIEKYSDIAELRHGYQFRDYDFTKSGTKICKITQLKGNGLIDISNCSFIDESRLDQFSKFIIKEGDILIALTGATIGKVGRFHGKETVLQNYRVGNFFPLNEKKLSKEYLYQFLSSNYFYNQILSGQTQSAQQNIGKEDVNNMLVILPPLPEQRAIAEILSSLDDKIELNLQTNKTLEEMANALYKEWFVDFGPFQNGKFFESELGLIPEGWEAKRLNDFIKFTKGKKPNKISEEYQEGFLPQILISSFDEGHSGFASRENVIISNDTDILMVMDGSGSGRTEIGFAGIVGSTLARIDFKVQFEHLRFATYLLLKTNQQIIKENTTGTSIPHTDKGFIFNFMIPAPSIKEIELFNTQISSFIEMIKLNLNENKELKKTRDYLLPKLISGEIRIKDIVKK